MKQFDAEQCRAALPFRTLIPALREAFAQGATVPLRHTHAIESQGVHGTTLIMPAWNEQGFFGVKTINIFPENGAQGLPGLHATYVLYSATTGVPLALIDGDAITARRTAGAAALGADFLARKDARRLLVVGAGRIAALLPAAMRAVRDIEHIDIWNPRPVRAAVLAETLRKQGVAHTFMAAEALEEGAETAGYTIKVETRGSVGAQNTLTPEEIAAADLVVIAADTQVDKSRFVGKRLYSTSTKAAIHDAGKVFDTAWAEAAPWGDGKAAAAGAKEETKAGSGGRSGPYKHLMTGVSFMLPFVVAGGLLIALAFALGAAAIHPGVEGLTESDGRAMRDADFEVNVWTVNDVEQARELSGVLSLYSVLQRYLGLALMLVTLLYVSTTLWGFYGAQIVAETLCLVVLARWFFRREPWSVRDFSAPFLKTLLRFSLPLVAMELSSVMLSLGDRVLIQPFDFRALLVKAAEHGVKDFVETGPSSVLSGIIENEKNDASCIISFISLSSSISRSSFVSAIC